MINTFTKGLKTLMMLALVFFLSTSLNAQVVRTIGFNVQQQHLDESDLNEMKQIGCNVVRLAFSARPLMKQKAPYQWNEQNWTRMHELIQYCQSINLRVIIDPHAMPGGSRPWTMLAFDKLYKDEGARQAFFKLWERIADECKGYGDVIWAYDLINEPPADGWLKQHNAKFSLNGHFYPQAVDKIRKIDDKHSILLEFREHDFQAGLVKSPAFYGGDKGKSKILVGPHMYWPLAYTHQGRNRPTGQKWPDASKGWTKANMMANNKGRLNNVINWGNQHGNWRVFIGEFGAVYTKNGAWDTNNPNQNPPKNGGHQYMNDCVDIFDSNGWSYTYHAWFEPNGEFDYQRPAPRWNQTKALIKKSTGGGGGGNPLPGDTQKPSKPGNISTSNITKTSVNLSWGASNDNVGVTGYNVYRGGTFVKSVNGTSTNVSSLTCETTYTFTVRAKDAAGNLSNPSNGKSVTTADCGGTPPPPPPPSGNSYRYLRLTVKGTVSKEVRIGEIRYRVGNTNYPKPSIVSGTKGQVSATTSQNTAWRAFDGKIGTGAWKVEKKFPSSIIIDLKAGKEIAPTAIVIEPAATDRGPSQFDVHGSNNMSNWTLLTSKSGLKKSDYPGKKGTFSISSSNREIISTPAVANQLTIQPVPCGVGDCDLTFSFTNNKWDNAQFQLMTVDGKTIQRGVLNQTGQSFSLNEVKRGIYYVALVKNGESITRKIAIR